MPCDHSRISSTPFTVKPLSGCVCVCVTSNDLCRCLYLVTLKLYVTPRALTIRRLLRRGLGSFPLDPCVASFARRVRSYLILCPALGWEGRDTWPSTRGTCRPSRLSARPWHRRMTTSRLGRSVDWLDGPRTAFMTPLFRSSSAIPELSVPSFSWASEHLRRTCLYPMSQGSAPHPRPPHPRLTFHSHLTNESFKWV